jgi:hypothetical protein
MSGRRLPLLVVLVVGLMAVVALVAHGRPLAANAGRGGVPSSFWNYVLTTVVILFALAALFVIATLLDAQLKFTKPQTSFVGMFLRSFIGIIAIGVGLVVLLRHLPHGLLQWNTGGGGGGSERLGGGKKAAAGSGLQFVWIEALVVFGLVAVAIAAVAVSRRRKRAKTTDTTVAPEVVAEALDESLDDLRTDPDLRRAIVAAYARMEKALRVTGLPREPAEAPLEYLERALGALDTSGPAVRRLTDLFEWAKFSHHEPEPAMRDEAVDALIAVRDELRAPVVAPPVEAPAVEAQA